MALIVFMTVATVWRSDMRISRWVTEGQWAAMRTAPSTTDKFVITGSNDLPLGNRHGGTVVGILSLPKLIIWMAGLALIKVRKSRSRGNWAWRVCRLRAHEWRKDGKRSDERVDVIDS